ncbi:MAG: B12-binding domain-containing protein, partial [Bacteroidota bacterium]
NCVLRMGMKDTYIKVIYPMMNRIGLLWMSDKISPAYEHFISNIIKQKMFVAIDSLPPAKSSGKTWLLFLPEDEFHEIGLLFSHYLIRQSGDKGIYLGSNVPLDTLLQTKTQINPSHLLLFFVHYNEPADLKEYLDVLNKNFSEVKIHVSGNAKLLGQLKTSQDIDWIHSVEDLEKQLS